MTLLRDATERHAARSERVRNVVIDAGAGTGKTETLVGRIVELVAPLDDGAAFSMSRVAAITFTRKAAGELALRVRERLDDAQRTAPTQLRRERLQRAERELDAAYVGTMHGFADRLLRELAVVSGLGPEYEILDDVSEMTGELHRRLLHAADTGTMVAALARTRVAGDSTLAEETSETIRLAQRAGLLASTRASDYYASVGLDRLFAEFCLRRDVTPEVPAPFEIDVQSLATAFGALRKSYDALAAGVRRSQFGRRLGAYLRAAEAALESKDVARIYACVVPELVQLGKYKPQMARDCDGDKGLWFVCKRLSGSEPTMKEPLRGGVAFDCEHLRAPLERWLATRLVRCFPAVVALYEQLCAERQAVDNVELLLRLRNLLRDNLDLRRRCQARFDHVLVDEFQDTDPLQAEIVLFLVEEGATARTWSEAVPARGKLTIVGDPKQSIYRFRRADVRMYDSVRRAVMRNAQDVLAVELVTNFRSTPQLVDWLDERCERLLGTAPDPAMRFDPATGKVFFRSLCAGRDPVQGPAVHVLPVDPVGADPRVTTEERRRRSATSVAGWIRGFLDDPDARVIDRDTGQARRPMPGDIAILVPVTTNLDPLFERLDSMDLPHATSGGRLFLQDPLHRRFLLALRGLSGRRDRDIHDGAALASLYAPPIFAVEPRVILNASRDEGPETARAQWAAVQAIVSGLRSGRNQGPAVLAAWHLLERSGLGSSIAMGANGVQRLSRLREVCHMVERQAQASGLDFDAVTAALRDGLDDPVHVDPPAPLGDEAISVLTIHSAKGLEWPVVVLWDCTASEEGRDWGAVWAVDREGERWAVGLDNLAHDHGGGLAAEEKMHLQEERKRLYYVACTRARDRLVIAWAPTAGWGKSGMHGVLVRGLDDAHAAQTIENTPVHAGPDGTAIAIAVDEDDPYSDERWAEARASASHGVARPIAVTAWAHASALAREEETVAAVVVETGDEPSDEAPLVVGRPRRIGRYGADFGSVVHLALEEVIERGAGVADAVQRSIQALKVAENLRAEAEQDVARALASLRNEGILGRPGVTVRAEYPVVGRGSAGEMLIGVIDLLACDDENLWVVDFKTDVPPAGAIDVVMPAYVEQLRVYEEIVRAALGGGRKVRCGLLFSADGGMRWVALRGIERG